MKALKFVVRNGMLLFVTFSIISYLSIMISLFRNVGLSDNPDWGIGFPVNYYYQFWVTGSCYPNSGWLFANALIDAAFALLVLIGFKLIHKVYLQDRIQKKR